MNVVFVTLLDFDGYSAVVVSGVKVQDDMSVDLLHMPKRDLRLLLASTQTAIRRSKGLLSSSTEALRSESLANACLPGT